MKSKLVPFAMDIASFLLEKTEERKNIKNIILFGSVAREEAEKQSDIDLFIDLNEENPKMEQELKKYVEKFYQTIKYQQYWKLLGIQQEVKLTTGKLSSWKELLPSIVANGITLYGKFTSEMQGKHQAIFFWENVSPNAKRVAFNKKMFGYTQHKKKYPGLLSRYQGQRMGKGCVIVDLHFAQEIHKLFKNSNISVKIKKIIVY
ncbi:nucleotidyltransferase domain-containing protein [Candidatus Woesearchaeota archaeon]|nr:nucleotidyltransferase domain-containing protein [Candidatus Woesearchaeota archaeon]